VKLFINPYAAIPSMHVAFSTMIGLTGVLIARHTITRVLWAAYPLLVFWVVVVTANHFWVDGAFGLLVAALSALTALQVLARVRPAVWSWRPATA
jgi:membrane-associated phospholipid phosphatase